MSSTQIKVKRGDILLDLRSKSFMPDDKFRDVYKGQGVAPGYVVGSGRRVPGASFLQPDMPKSVEIFVHDCLGRSHND
jgi:G:T-mismatch repair DNA endonuclease (very short patch repair protein)